MQHTTNKFKQFPIILGVRIKNHWNILYNIILNVLSVLLRGDVLRGRPGHLHQGPARAGAEAGAGQGHLPLPDCALQVCIYLSRISRIPRISTLDSAVSPPSLRSSPTRAAGGSSPASTSWSPDSPPRRRLTRWRYLARAPSINLETIKRNQNLVLTSQSRKPPMRFHFWMQLQWVKRDGKNVMCPSNDSMDEE